MTLFSLLHRRVTAMLDTMLPYDCSDSKTDAADFTERPEEARQGARVRITSQQDYDAQRYNGHHQCIVYQPGQRVG